MPDVYPNSLTVWCRQDKEDEPVKKLSGDAEKIMAERFGKDTIIALATVENEVPSVRYVNAYYEDGTFYIITYALSNKMKHIENNPAVAIAGEWFTAHGKGINLGYFGKKSLKEVKEKIYSLGLSFKASNE